MVTKEPATATVADRFLAALGARDLDALVGCFAPDVDWFIAGNEAVAPWLGRKQGPAEIRQFYEVLWASTELINFDLQHTLLDGDYCVFVGELTSRMVATGKIYESMFSGHLTVSGDAISRYRVQEDSWGLVEALTR